MQTDIYMCTYQKCISLSVDCQDDTLVRGQGMDSTKVVRIWGRDEI